MRPPFLAALPCEVASEGKRNLSLRLSTAQQSETADSGQLVGLGLAVVHRQLWACLEPLVALD